MKKKIFMAFMASFWVIASFGQKKVKSQYLIASSDRPAVSNERPTPKKHPNFEHRVMYQGPVPHKSPKRELRGVWVSTVQRVDYPSHATTNIDELRKEWMDLLQYYQELNLNTVIVQIRPTGDAIYPSKIVPYSKWLTGKSGKPLDGNADLLAYMIKTAHEEGFEFHAWVNPYRVIIDEDTTDLDPRHPLKAHPEWVVKYGREYIMNPGIPAVWRYLTDVVGEVVKKYDVDAVHFDDYFYPYRIANEPFPDKQAFAKYGKKFADVNDWRRANTDSLMWNVRKVIKKNKPHVQLGVSPFAVWRNKSDDPNGSDTKAFQRCYDDLYANVLLWIQRGWLDYVAPEIYFNIGHPLVDYKTILDWWASHSEGTNLYVSHAIYKINRQEKFPAWNDPDEIPRQLNIARSNEHVKGLVFFSSKWLKVNDPGVTSVLRDQFFIDKAELPQSVK
ncbi:MAG: family 10 glycosylhydrolase [Flectobacillus sp.]|nr:family 10 glycosylhydrolase [Flectobacillus sp.]